MTSAAVPRSALVVDDLAEARRWVRAAVEQAFAGIAVTEAADAASALLALQAGAPDLVLLDLGLPDESGLKVLERLRRDHPQARCVVATIFDDDEHLFHALRLGAQGYVLKEQAQPQLADMLRAMLEGHPPLSPAVARRMVAYFRGVPEAPGLDALSQREREVLQLIAKGFSARGVGDALALSTYTVQDHVKSIYRKLEVASRAEAVLSARRMGLV